MQNRKIIIHKCPVCEWTGRTKLPNHIIESTNEQHTLLKETIVKNYLEDKMSTVLISEKLNITYGFIGSILKKLNIKTRNLQQAIVNAIQQGVISGYPFGICGHRNDLVGIFRSTCEANFARLLDYEKVSYKREIAYSLYDENKKLLCTYFLDFLINDEQGFEIKGYENNGDFPNKEKIMLFQKQHPEIKLKVLFCSSKEWDELEKKYSKLIPMW